MSHILAFYVDPTIPQECILSPQVHSEDPEGSNHTNILCTLSTLILKLGQSWAQSEGLIIDLGYNPSSFSLGSALPVHPWYLSDGHLSPTLGFISGPSPKNGLTVQEWKMNKS